MFPLLGMAGLQEQGVTAELPSPYPSKTRMHVVPDRAGV